MHTRDQQLDAFRLILDAAGVAGALRYLNGLTRYRFSAIYLFDRDKLHNHALVDRDDADAALMPELPVTASYCVFVRDSGAPFSTADAPHDERVGAHPKRHEIKAYCGVPLVDEFGLLYGSICHFDVDPQPPDADQAPDVELLQAVGPLLRCNVVQGMPSAAAAP